MDARALKYFQAMGTRSGESIIRGRGLLSIGMEFQQGVSPAFCTPVVLTSPQQRASRLISCLLLFRLSYSFLDFQLSKNAKLNKMREISWPPIIYLWGLKEIELESASLRYYILLIMVAVKSEMQDSLFFLNLILNGVFQTTNSFLYFSHKGTPFISENLQGREKTNPKAY